MASSQASQASIMSLTPPQTDKVYLCPTHPLYGDNTHPDRFKLSGEEYVRWKEVDKAGAERESTSKLWQYGEALIRKSDSKKVFYCYVCETEGKQQRNLRVLNGTRGGLTHLQSTHDIDKDGNKIIRKQSQPTLQQHHEHSQLVTKVDGNAFRRLLVRWIVYCMVPFLLVENRYFRELVGCLNSAILLLLPFAASTVRKWVMDEYLKYKECLMMELRQAKSRIHVSFDLWTSPNHHAIISVYSHYIGRDGKRHTKLLAFRRIIGEHSGANQAAALKSVLDEYEVAAYRVGFFVGDNASSNDTAVVELMKMYYPSMSLQHRQQRRLRCLGHIINLCARAMLLGKGANKAMVDLEHKLGKGAFEAVDSFWRGRGAVGKVHNIIRYVRSSPQRLQFFAGLDIRGVEKVEKVLQLIMDNATRWNSFYYMIERAERLQKRIKTFLKEYPKAFPSEAARLKQDTLTKKEWQQLKKTGEVLDVFETVTMRAQGETKSYSDWFPSLMWMLDTLQDFKTELAGLARKDKVYSYLSECCEHSWAKAEKYFKLVDDMPMAYAAVALDPTRKLQWFKQVWAPKGQLNYVDEVEKLLKDLWVREYKGKFGASSHVNVTPAPYEDGSLHASLFNFKRVKLSHDTTEAPVLDAFDEYLATSLVPDPQAIDSKAEPFDVAEYWMNRYSKQPDLATFALDCLAIPLMSDAPERSFSAGRDLLTYRRSNLKDDITQACACLRSWYGPPKSKEHKDGQIEEAFDDEEVIEQDYNKDRTQQAPQQVQVSTEAASSDSSDSEDEE